MTRVTDSMRTSHLLWNMSNIQSSMDKTSTELTTYSKLNKLSDDPLAIARVLRIRTGRDEITQFKSNINRAKSWLTATESALDQAGTLMQRARELAVQMSNGTYNDEQRANTAKEINQLLESAVDIGNSNMEGNYLFGGYRSNYSPYQVSKNGANISGNTGYVKTEISTGVYMDYNTPNNRAFVLTPGEKPDLSTSAPGEISLDSAKKGIPNSTVTVRVSGVDDNNNPVRIQADLGDGYWREIDVPWSKDASGNSVINYPLKVSLGSDQGFSFSINGKAKVGDTHRVLIDDAGQIKAVQNTAGYVKSGNAMASFTGVGYDSGTSTYTMKAGDKMTLNFVIDDHNYSLDYVASKDNPTTVDIEEAIKRSDGALKNLVDTYGEGETPPWRTTALGAGEIVFALKDSQAGKSFSFWTSKVLNKDGAETTSLAGTMYSSGKVTFKPEESLIADTNPADPTKLLTGNYSIGMTKNAGVINALSTKQYGKLQGTAGFAGLLTSSSFNAATSDGNLSYMFEVTGVDSATGQVSGSYKAYITDINGTVTTVPATALTLNAGAVNTVNVGGSGVQIDLNLKSLGNFSVGDKIAVNGQHFANATSDQLQQVSLSRVDHGEPDAAVTLAAGYFAAHGDAFNAQFYQLDETTGQVMDSQYKFNCTAGAWNGSAATVQGLGDAAVGSSFGIASAGTFQVRKLETHQERDVFMALADFRDALNNDDTDGISKALDEMARGLDSVLVNRSEMGAKENRLDLTDNRLTDSDYSLEKLASSLEDTDVADAIMRYESQETVYRAILSMGAKVIQPSLMDFLR